MNTFVYNAVMRPVAVLLVAVTLAGLVSAEELCEYQSAACNGTSTTCATFNASVPQCAPSSQGTFATVTQGTNTPYELNVFSDATCTRRLLNVPLDAGVCTAVPTGLFSSIYVLASGANGTAPQATGTNTTTGSRAEQILNPAQGILPNNTVGDAFQQGLMQATLENVMDMVRPFVAGAPGVAGEGFLGNLGGLAGNVGEVGALGGVTGGL